RSGEAPRGLSAPHSRRQARRGWREARSVEEGARGIAEEAIAVSFHRFFITKTRRPRRPRNVSRKEPIPGLRALRCLRDEQRINGLGEMNIEGTGRMTGPMRMLSALVFIIAAATTSSAAAGQTDSIPAPPDVKAPPPDAVKTPSGLATKVL